MRANDVFEQTSFSDNQTFICHWYKTILSFILMFNPDGITPINGKWSVNLHILRR